MENIGLANSLMKALASADPTQKNPVPLLKRTEEKLMALWATAPPERGVGRTNYDVLPNLFMMAYDGFIINWRLNDLRDIERLSDALCDIILAPAEKL